MAYITFYLRKNRNRRLATGKSKNRSESATSVNASLSVPSHGPYQIDFETWISRLVGWNPIPMQTVSGLMLLKAREGLASKAA